MFLGMIMPETAVSLCRTVKEPGNAASLAENVLVNLLEPTATVSARSLWQASDPKGKEACKWDQLGSSRLHRPDMRRAYGRASQQKWKGR